MTRFVWPNPRHSFTMRNHAGRRVTIVPRIATKPRCIASLDAHVPCLPRDRSPNRPIPGLRVALASTGISASGHSRLDQNGLWHRRTRNHAWKRGLLTNRDECTTSIMHNASRVRWCRMGRWHSPEHSGGSPLAMSLESLAVWRLYNPRTPRISENRSAALLGSYAQVHIPYKVAGSPLQRQCPTPTPQS